MLDLRQGRIGIRLINQSVQLLDRLPNRHLGPLLLVELLTSLQVVVQSLLCMLLGVELLRDQDISTEVRKSRQAESNRDRTDGLTLTWSLASS